MALSRTCVLFVCLGNICRSPLAEGVFRAVVAQRGAEDRFLVDSAGTGGWHVGSAPDPRSVRIAADHGIDIATQTCRRVTDADFERFDLILGMDRSNVAELILLAPPHACQRVRLFHELATGEACEIPDPYYRGQDGFLHVYRMVRDASEALADRLECRTDSDLPRGQASSTR
jgi:protein-tyrosine phosphatase